MRSGSEKRRNSRKERSARCSVASRPESKPDASIACAEAEENMTGRCQLSAHSCRCIIICTHCMR